MREDISEVNLNTESCGVCSCKSGIGIVGVDAHLPRTVVDPGEIILNPYSYAVHILPTHVVFESDVGKIEIAELTESISTNEQLPVSKRKGPRHRQLL